MRRMKAALVCLSLLVATAALAEENDEELAKKLTNPVADLISVPFQFNYDQGIGPTNEGQQYYLKFQPVVPISIGDDWNVISRTILPVIYTNRFVPPFDGPNFGTGDTVQSFFFSPKKPSSWGGIIWGAGPAFQLPTATNGSLGAQKWGAGPTVVMLKMAGPVTAGFLANQIWGFAGNDNRKRFNQTFFQPFVTLHDPHRDDLRREPGVELRLRRQRLDRPDERLRLADGPARAADHAVPARLPQLSHDTGRRRPQLGPALRSDPAVPEEVMRKTALALATVPLVLVAIWCCAALWIDGPTSRPLAGALVGAFRDSPVSRRCGSRGRTGARSSRSSCCARRSCSGGCASRPATTATGCPTSHELPRAQLDGNILTVENVRDFAYRSENDYDAHWVTRKYDLSKLEHLDMFFSFWGPTEIAHTIMSWSFAEGPALAISIETRKEKGESYSALLGFFRQYELYYVVARERDVIGIRDRFRGEHTYLYRLSAPPELARELLLSYVKEINQIAEHPEWYNAFTGNCTTSIRNRVLSAGGAVPLDWRLFANGHLPELMYERGSLDQSLPFEELVAKSEITERAKAAGNAEDFSQQIRKGLPRMGGAP